VHDIRFRNGAPMRRKDRVSGEPGDHDLLLIDRVFPDGSLIESGIAMDHTIRYVPQIVPILHTKRRGPTHFDDLGSGNLLPLTVLFDFESQGSIFTLFERIELRGEFEYVGVDRI